MKRMKTKKNIITKNEVHEEIPSINNPEEFVHEIDQKIEKIFPGKNQIGKKHPKSAKLI